MSRHPLLRWLTLSRLVWASISQVFSANKQSRTPKRQALRSSNQTRNLAKVWSCKRSENLNILAMIAVCRMARGFGHPSILAAEFQTSLNANHNKDEIWKLFKLHREKPLKNNLAQSFLKWMRSNKKRTVAPRWAQGVSCSSGMLCHSLAPKPTIIESSEYTLGLNCSRAISLLIKLTLKVWMEAIGITVLMEVWNQNNDSILSPTSNLLFSHLVWNL